MGGPTRSEKLEARVEEFAADVEAYASLIEMPVPEPRIIDQYLNISPIELHSLDEVQLAEIAVEVSLYAYYLQDEVNKKQGKVDRYTHQINKLVYPVMHQYQAFRDEDKVLQATLDDQDASIMHDQRFNVQTMITRLQSLGQRLVDIASKIDSLSYKKGKRHG